MNLKLKKQVDCPDILVPLDFRISRRYKFGATLKDDQFQRFPRATAGAVLEKPIIFFEKW